MKSEHAAMNETLTMNFLNQPIRSTHSSELNKDLEVGSEFEEERQEMKEFTQDVLTSERKDIELLDFMLSYLPKFCPVKEGVATAFNHLVPMTVEKFGLVAE